MENRWEGKQGSWPNRFYATLKNSLLHPTAFFSEIAKGDNFASPILYALVNSAILIFVSALFSYAVKFHLLPTVGMKLTSPSVASGFFAGPGALAIAIFIIPFVVVGYFITAALFHMGLYIVGGVKQSFIATFRVVCYSTGAQLFAIIPFLGGIVAGIWMLVLHMIGLKIVHETDFLRAAFAVLLPVLLCCGILIFLFTGILAGGLLAALIG
ncbi:YIP1 family protein [Patescibacteria group bacterium]|nr:YIP1 family protein [Patescibacteria group bacterium]